MELLCLGEPMVEFTKVRDVPQGAEFLQGFGGDTSNVAVAAARQGARVGYVSAIGRDSFGDSLLALWQREGIETALVRRVAEASTGIYFITPHPAGRSFAYFRSNSAASRMRPADIPDEAVAAAKILHVSAISQAISASACDAVFRAIEVARAHGVLVSYDSNLRLNLWPLDRARAVTHEAMRHCDIALPSLDDSRQLTGLQTPDEIADFYLALGAKVVALKLGAEGAFIVTSAVRRLVAPYAVEPIDATGAGDAFDGAFLAAYLGRPDPVAAAERAAVVAALTTCGYGAINPIPHAAEIDRRLKIKE
ncbi:MAG: sugar kinase [Dongiaceae bacterium]